MRLIDCKTGTEIHEGTQLAYGRDSDTCYVSHIDVQKKQVFLYNERRDQPFLASLRALNARFAA